ncbi:MAG: hypothetical protein LQ350_007497 [Teloschistes chrysophthalmus]|nr:MAG: hypothetical protein LQ350_007497 [Niorma chrysophthalma]
MQNSFPASGTVIQYGDTADKVREWSSVIGIVTAIVGNILISFALNIQRYAHIRLKREKDGKKSGLDEEYGRTGHKNYGTQQAELAEERAKANLEPSSFNPNGDPDDHDDAHAAKRTSFSSESSSQSTVKPPEKQNLQSDTRTYLSSPYWWIGIVLMVIGEGGNFLAYGFAPASIVSPLGVVALVSNCIIAPCLLKERFRQRDFWGVVVAVAGAVVIVLSAKNSETKMGPHHIWLAITRWEFELYLGLTAAMIIVLIWASARYGHKSILIDLGLVGLFGGYTALSTKGVASLLSDTLWRTLTFPITYLLLVVLVLSAVMQIRYVNRALQRFDSTQVIPIQFVLFTISVIIGSAVLYQDFRSATAAMVGEFVGGCLLTFLGVYLITSGRSRENEEDDDVLDDDEEGAINLIDEERLEDEAEANAQYPSSRRKSSIDFTFDGTPNSSRRSSRQLSLPQTPQRHHSAASSANLSRTPTNQSDHLRTPMTQNRTENFYTPPTRPRPRNLEPTTSTPLLPSDAHRSIPASPTPTRFPSHQNPQLSSTQEPPKPQRQNPSRRSSPIKNSDQQRPATLSRNSINHLRPGPFTSPLSSSLAAIVADAQRRDSLASPSPFSPSPSPSPYQNPANTNNSNNNNNNRRRPRLESLRKNKSQRPAEDVESLGQGGDGGGSGGEREAREREREGGRRQSIGAALGEFLRLKWRRERGGRGDEEDVGDEAR